MDAEKFEWKPGYSLVKYGSIYTMNFNQEFAQRFSNVLRDCGMDEVAVNNLGEDLKFCLSSHEDTIDPDNNEYMLSKFGHVYLLTFKRDFAMQVNAAMQKFLLSTRVSGAMFSFSQQLDGYLLNKFSPKNHSVTY